jgi:putative NADPH-quinone reductase
MRVAVVVAHPNPDSFSHAVARTARDALERAGHEVTVLDLYAEGFVTAMTLDERHAYHGDQPILDPLVARHAEVVTHAAGLVFIYPTWWSTVPAILKGWLERVMVPGVGFVFDARQHVRPGLRHVRHLVGISTYGASWPLVKLTNDNGRRTLMRALRLNTGWRTRRTWLALYRIDLCTAQQRERFLQRVRRTMERL